MTITYEEYVGQVFEFLDKEPQAHYSSEGSWDEMRLGVAALIEALLSRGER